MRVCPTSRAVASSGYATAIRLLMWSSTARARRPAGGARPATIERRRVTCPHPSGVTRRHRDHPVRVTMAHPASRRGLPRWSPVSDTRYEIRIRGRVSAAVLDTFDAMESDVEPVETILHGPVRDQAELHGLLRRLQSLGLELIEVRRLPESGHGHHGMSPSSRPRCTASRRPDGVELAIDRLQVGLDRVDRDEQLAGDLLVGHHRRQVAQDRLLALAQRLGEQHGDRPRPLARRDARSSSSASPTIAGCAVPWRTWRRSRGRTAVAVLDDEPPQAGRLGEVERALQRRAASSCSASASSASASSSHASARTDSGTPSARGAVAGAEVRSEHVARRARVAVQQAQPGDGVGDGDRRRGLALGALEQRAPRLALADRGAQQRLLGQQLVLQRREQRPVADARRAPTCRTPSAASGSPASLRSSARLRACAARSGRSRVSCSASEARATRPPASSRRPRWMATAACTQ